MVAIPTKPRSPTIAFAQRGDGAIQSSTVDVIDVIATVSSAPPASPGSQPLKRLTQSVTTQCLQPLKQQRAAIMTGMAIALTSVGLAQTLTHTSEYEGRVQVAVRPDDASLGRVEVGATQFDALENKTSTVDSGAIAAPGVISPISNFEQPRFNQPQIEGLTSPTLLDPAIARLRADGIEIDYAALVGQLHVTALANGVIEVRYRGADPQQVEMVLNEITKSYTQSEQTCNVQVCQDVEFMQTQLPHIQSRIETRQAALNAFRQQHQLADLQAQQQQAIALANPLKQQRQHTQAKLKAATDQVNALATQLGQQATVTDTVLAQDSRYQMLMDQLRSLEAMIAQELQQPQIRQVQLDRLYEQYQTVVMQLQEQAKQTAGYYWVDSTIDTTTSAATIDQVQQWFDAAHQLEVLSLHQQTLSQLNQQLDQRTAQLTTLLEQETRLQDQLQDAKTLFEQYSTKLQTLQTQMPPQNSWELVAPPELLQSAAQSTSPSDNYRDVGMAVLLGALFGVGVAAITEGCDRSLSPPLSSHPFSNRPAS